MTPGEFYQTVRAGLLAEEIAVLPPTADCVSVGDMDRSRAASVECLLVLGANDGCLPRTPRPSSILPQREVERMEAAGLWLGNDAQLRMAEEEWTVYGAFSKPKGRLYLSYSALDGRGTPRGRSPVVSDLLRLFPELRVYPAQAYGNARGYAVTAQSGAAAARTAAGAYGRGKRWTEALARCTGSAGIAWVGRSRIYTGWTTWTRVWRRSCFCRRARSPPRGWSDTPGVASPILWKAVSVPRRSGSRGWLPGTGGYPP